MSRYQHFVRKLLHLHVYGEYGISVTVNTSNLVWFNRRQTHTHTHMNEACVFL